MSMGLESSKDRFRVDRRWLNAGRGVDPVSLESAMLGRPAGRRDGWTGTAIAAKTIL